MDFRPDCDGFLNGTALRTNKVGLRGPNLRADGSRRILAIGDSCTFGWRVSEDETYPAQLEGLLNQRAGGERYQVINAGVPGYTSYQGLEYLRERGLALRPEIVLIGFGFNDAYRSGDIENQLARAHLTTPFFVADDALIYYSSFYRWLRWRANQLAPKDLPPRVSPEKYGRNLGAIIEAVQATGANPVLVNFWSPIGDGKDYRDALQAVATRTGTPIVWYAGMRMDVVHPTAAGYRDLGHDIADKLAETGSVPEPPADQNAT
jgi:lysophospholipase L1-like esterase